MDEVDTKNWNLQL